MAQQVAHVIGNDEVISSNLISSSKTPNAFAFGVFILLVIEISRNDLFLPFRR